MINILFIGDIVGRPGRTILTSTLEKLRRETTFDLVIANGENAAGGTGMDPATTQEIFRAGVTVITTGNHIWKRREIFPILESNPHVIRPANYAPGNPGRGWTRLEVKGVPIVVANLAGRVFMYDLVDCPFRAADAIIEAERKLEEGREPLFIFDFHGEATSEKVAFGLYVDGRAQGVFGTHTHVTTADERVLPKGTAYITDVGMCGSRDGVIGVDGAQIIERFLLGRPVRSEMAKGQAIFSAVHVEVDEGTRRAVSIRRITAEE